MGERDILSHSPSVFLRDNWVVSGYQSSASGCFLGIAGSGSVVSGVRLL